MAEFVYIFVYFVRYLLFALQLAMFFRAMMSWLPGGFDNKIGQFIYTLTDYIVMPIRAFFKKYNLFSNTPMDIPFLTAFLILMVLSMVLPTV